MGKIRKWLIEFVLHFGATIVTIYVIYQCTGWSWFNLNSDHVLFFAGFFFMQATDSVIPRWRIKSYWRLTSENNVGKNYTKFFHVEKRVATFFWRKWYATQDEERATKIFESLKNNF